MKTKLQSIIERVVAYGIILVCIIVLIYYFGNVNKRQSEMGKAKNAELAGIRTQIAQANEELEERKSRVQTINNKLAFFLSELFHS